MTSTKKLTTIKKKKNTSSTSQDIFESHLVPRGEWIKYWSLRFSLLSGSLLGKYWAQTMKQEMGETITPLVITHHNAITECHVRIVDRKRYADKQLALRFKDNSVKEFCTYFNSLTDELLSTTKKLLSPSATPTITPPIMKKFIDQYRFYYGYYVTPRHLIDFADESTAKLIIDDLRASRLRAEPAATECDKVLRKFMDDISKNVKISTDALLCMTSDDIDTYLAKETLPTKKVLEERLKGCGIVYTSTTETITTDQNQVHALSHLAVQSTTANEVKGTVAFKGIAYGTVRIVMDPTQAKVFNEGDILMTGMTRPDFLPIMKKAGAIVTDAGGMLCHAAIVAREFGKPCVIGTQSATKVFKDGDSVEVDANRGVVRRLQKK